MNFPRVALILIFMCVVVAIYMERAKTNTGSLSEELIYNYYNQSCPLAEAIIRSTVQELYQLQPDIAPALLRIAFHDCFVHGCDASVLLNGRLSEKLAPPNLSLKRFDVIGEIKSRLEDRCPGVVSCADIVVLAARESVDVTGGPFYQLRTGRRDSMHSFLNETASIPSAHSDLRRAIASFAAKGFDARELVVIARKPIDGFSYIT